MNKTIIAKKKIKPKSIQVYKKGARIYIFATACTKVVKRTIKNHEKSGNFLRDSITISLAILCGIFATLSTQALNDED